MNKISRLLIPFILILTPSIMGANALESSNNLLCATKTIEVSPSANEVVS